MEHASVKRGGGVQTVPFHVQRGRGVQAAMPHASVLTTLSATQPMVPAHARLDGEEICVTSPALWETLAQAASINVTASMMKVAIVLQDSASVCQAGRVCVAQSNVHKVDGAVSVIRAARASTAPPVCHTVGSACVNLAIGDLSVSMCVVRVSMGRSAVKLVLPVSTPPHAITSQASVCVYRAIQDSCVSKCVQLVTLVSSAVVCVGVPTMPHVIIRMDHVTVSRVGLDQTVLCCVKQGHLGLTVIRCVRAPLTIHVTLTLVRVCVKLDPEWTVHKSEW